MPKAEKAKPTRTKNTARSAGEGTYFRDGDDYCWRLRKGPRGAQRIVGFARAKTSAALKIAVRKELARIAESGETPKPEVDRSSIAFRLDEWFAKMAAGSQVGRTEQNTISTYRHQLKHIKAAVGTRPARSAGATEAAAVLAYYSEGGKSVWTQLKGLQVFCQALGLNQKKLQEEGLVVPKMPSGRERVLSDEEAADFLEELFAEGEVTRRDGTTAIEPRYRDRFSVCFMLNTGLRINETLGVATVVALMGLKTGILDVRCQLKRLVDPTDGSKVMDPLTGEQAWILGDTKGDEQRKVPLNDVAQELIRKQLAMVAEEKEAAGDGYRDNGLLFPTSSGRPHNARNVLRTVTSVQDRINARRASEGKDPYEHWTDHDLRRTFGTHLAGAEDNIHIVAKILGHADIETTRKYYAHAQESRLREAGAKISFGRKTS